MPRVKLFDKDEALKKAMELFWEKGYAATSLQDLTEHLGIGKGSFYATFKSKRNLFFECIDRYTALNLPVLDQALKADQDFRVVLQALLEDYVDALLNDQKRKGCFMANSCTFAHHQNAALADKVLEHYNQIEKLLMHRMTEEGYAAGKSKSVASMIVTFLIGMSQQSKINSDRNSYLATIDQIISLLD